MKKLILIFALLFCSSCPTSDERKFCYNVCKDSLSKVGLKNYRIYTNGSYLMNENKCVCRIYIRVPISNKKVEKE